MNISESESCTQLLKNLNKCIEMYTRQGTFVDNQHLTILLPVSDGVTCVVDPSAIINLHVVVSTFNIPHSFILGRI